MLDVLEVPTSPVIGHAAPRIAPPVPIRHAADEFGALSAKLGYPLRPWQEVAARYLTAEGPGETFHYREVAIVVARQNGKTTLLLALIVQRLLAGHRIMHTAQDGRLPRELHRELANLFQKHYPDLIPSVRGISYVIGAETIRLTTGGEYRVVPPTDNGARGFPMDTIIIDELREMESFDFIAAAQPTNSASAHPQIVYLSNAGSEKSEVLNSVKARAAEDPQLAYLEWSSEAERRTDDVEGWAEANPSLGHSAPLYASLMSFHRSLRLANKLPIFETEHLCRWVATLTEPLVTDFDWARCGPAQLSIGRRVYMGIALEPDGSRASAAIAWRMADKRVALRMVFDYTGSPIDTDELGEKLRAAAIAERVVETGYGKLTDQQLVKFLRKGSAKAIEGPDHASATSRFVELVEGDRLRWDDAAAVTEDLVWTTRKPHDESGSFKAVRADDERPITAALAAVRAVWLASEPPHGKAMIY